MERRERLSDQALERELKDLAGWAVAGGKLRREYRFPDFIEAWGFMSSAALVIQQMDHHPEWSNVYGTVVVELVTHDSGGITARDVELARRMEAIAARRAAG
jgi:4a-hydroxytetrahydrobiopterin dehydratase